MTEHRESSYMGSVGEIYERYLVPAIFASWARDLVAQASLQPGERVLDLACGTGVVTREAAERLAGTGRVVGLDLSPGMLAVARAASVGQSIVWQEGDATAMPFEPGAFDVILCQQGLQFVPDKVAALREMHRVLTPGGRVFLSVWRSTRDTPGWRALEEARARIIGSRAAALPPFSFGDPRQLRMLVAEAGFRDIRIRADVKMTRFSSAEAFVRFNAASRPPMLGPLANQDEEALSQIVAEVENALATAVDDDGLAFPQASNVVAARKP